MVSPIRLEDAIMEKEEIRDIILESMVASLEAQVRALKKLRGSPEAESPREKSMSQIGIVVNILTGAKRPLHVSEIIAKAEKVFGAKLERESLVSALSKKVMKGDRFMRTGKNTFALKGEG
jgi:F420-0:gamma-glutamyl ligase